MENKPVGSEQQPAELPINSCFRKAAEDGCGTRGTNGAGYYDATADKTFFCPGAKEAERYVGEFDHQTGQFGEMHRIAAEKSEVCGQPVLVAGANGSPLLFYCTREGALVQWMGQPHTIAESFLSKTISTEAVCDLRVVTANDYLYVFYTSERESCASYRTLHYMRSGDGGETWEPPVAAIDSQQADADGCHAVMLHDARYLPYCGAYPERIQLTWSMGGMVCGDETPRQGVYLAYLSLEDFKLYSPAGKCMSELLCYGDMTEQCVVRAEGNDVRGAFSAALPQTGAPAVFVAAETETGAPQMLYYRFDEVAWTVAGEAACALCDAEVDRSAAEVRLACLENGHALLRRFDGESWIKELYAPLPQEAIGAKMSLALMQGDDTRIVGMLTTGDTKQTLYNKEETRPIYLWIRENTE